MYIFVYPCYYAGQSPLSMGPLICHAMSLSGTNQVRNTSYTISSWYFSIMDQELKKHLDKNINTGSYTSLIFYDSHTQTNSIYCNMPLLNLSKADKLVFIKTIHSFTLLLIGLGTIYLNCLVLTTLQLS